MPSSDRGKRSSFVAVGAIAFFLALLAMAVGAVYWGLSKQIEYEWQAERNEAQYTGRTYGPERDSCVWLPAQDQANCIADAANKAREYQRSEQDLVAQRTMAVWTFIMGSAAIVGVFLSAFGVFLVWTTFNATREANRIAREVGEAGLRPWVLFKFDLRSTPVGVEIDHPDSIPFRCDFNVENYGKSPAFNVDRIADVVQPVNEIVHEEELRRFCLGCIDMYAPGIDLGPGDSTVLRGFNFNARRAHIASSFNDGKIIRSHFVVYACVLYTDAAETRVFVGGQAIMVVLERSDDRTGNIFTNVRKTWVLNSLAVDRPVH